VKQRRVGEHTIEIRFWKIQGQKILVQNFNAGLAPCHLDEGERAVESDGTMAEVAEGEQISPRSASEIEDAVGTRTLQFSE
jgi:hypothetical protein